MSNNIVKTVGSAFVDKVSFFKPASAMDVKAEFAEFAGQIDGSLERALGQFVKSKLAKNPKTAWMAQVLSPEAAGPEARASDAVVIEGAMTQAAALNADLHKPRQDTGVHLKFVVGGHAVRVSDVAERMNDGEAVEMTATSYEKASNWSVVRALFQGKFLPELDGVSMKSQRRHETHRLTSATELASAVQDATLQS